MDDLTRLDEDQLFRRFLRAPGAELWQEIALRNLDRIKVHVATFRFPGGRFIPEFEQGIVVTDAWERMTSMEFRGSSIGELRNAVRKTCWHTCMDWGRRHMARDRHIAGSLDEPGHAETGSGSKFDPAVAEVSRDREEQAADAAEADELRSSQIALVRWAISQVRNDNYREVLYMTYVQRADAETIAARLEISLDNVYQRRRRGNLELEKILRDHRT